MLRRGLAAALLALLPPLLCLASPLAAQEFGQWWWDGALTLGQRQVEDARAGFETTDLGQRESQLSLGLNGYLLHPALGNFRLGVDLNYTQLQNGRTVDKDTTGYSLDLDVLPRGAFPGRFFYRRQSFQFSGLAEGEPRALSALPATSSVAGARLRVRRGVLRGAFLGLEHTSLSFDDPEVDDQTEERAFVDWSRKLGRLQHHVRLEQTQRDFPFADLKVEDLNITLTQEGELTDIWRWQLFGTGILRALTVDAQAQSDFDDWNLRNILTRPVGEHNRLEIQSTLTLGRNGSGTSSQGFGVGVFYRLRLKPSLELAPFAEYLDQSSDFADSQAPRVGTVFTWRRPGPVVEALVTTQTSYSTIQRDTILESKDEKVLAFGLTGTLAHGSTVGLRKELEVEIARNDLRLTREPLLELPDLGLPTSGLRREDMARARLRLTHQWRRSGRLDGWGEWSRRESLDELPDSGFDAETFSGNAQLGAGRFTLQLTSGRTTVMQAARAEQDIRFDGASLGWRPLRRLSLRTTYRSDRRLLELTPDLDVERLEAGLSYQIGQIILNAEAFEQRESIDGGFVRTYRGFRWTLSRRFAGWLPIVTGIERRGTIR